MSDLKAYILFPAADQSPLYKCWLGDCPIPVAIVREYTTDWMPPDDAGILITHNHYRWEEISILRRVVDQDKVPVLILADGILEYRNSFEHPGLADGAMFQPLIGHKLACIGRSQARFVEAWGNVGKCEVIGMPCFDNWIENRRNPSPAGGSFELMVATARSPYFDDMQRDETIAALSDLQSWLHENKKIDEREINVRWRLTDELHQELRVPKSHDRKTPVQQTLDTVDAVITTPSTLQLEAALNQLPVAILDYHNCPVLAPMAWSISSGGQIGPVVSQLVQPPPSKMLVQKTLLYDHLQAKEPATTKLYDLIRGMVECRVVAREQNLPLSFPGRMIADNAMGFPAVESPADLSHLFPDNSAFTHTSVQLLQAELSQAVQEMGNYPQKYFDQRAANRRLRSYINWLRTIIRNRAATIEQLRADRDKSDRSDSNRPVK